MIKFYYSGAPNPVKVAIALEEMGLSYEAIPIDTRKSEQFAPDFMALNPNAKVPVIVDDGQVIFDSNAILLYLADKTNQFVPAIGSAERGTMLSWLMFIASGVGPFSGQAVHFRHMAPEPNPYSLNRYDYEAERHWNLVNDQLGKSQYMLGDEYTIVDMSVWGWARMVPFVLGNDNAWDKLPNLKRLLDEVSARPAAQKAEELRTKHKFKTELDDEARKSMFPQNERL
jgi:GST-like protein